MKYIDVQYNMLNLQFFFILIISLNFLLFFILGCNTKLNQKNYHQCIDKIEEERQKERVGNRFSYKAQSYEECRAPVRYRLEAD